ncbi:MAG: sugar ABC transporter ATP-binding protein [Fimbriimonas sp.]
MLEVRNIKKSFPAVQALDGVSLTFAPGEVHGVIGENGAGKSTLMKILSGIEQPTSGEILLDGKPITFHGPRDAIALGIAMIHQELNLVDELNVAENIFLGRERVRGLAVDRERTFADAKKALDEVAAPFGPDTSVAELSIAGKQLVEIAKAVSYDAKILIMDEPTAVLSEREITALFALIQRLKERGITVIYISHILKELLQICDRISVLRDGKWVATHAAGEVNATSLAKLMVGRELGDFYPPKAPSPTGDPVFEVRDLGVGGIVKQMALTLRKGEILGLAGLVGSGRTETAEAITGLRSRSSGTILRNGKEVGISSPADALRYGITYVSEDRKGSGLHLTMTNVENTVMANLRVYAKPVINRGAEQATFADWTKRLDIRVGDPNAPVGMLSGGNQQKVSVAKWLDTKPEVLILDEPTRGVDVGAKREIYNLIQMLAGEGLSCLVISSEMPELLGLCHRILVLRNGELAGELTEGQMTEENIMLLAAGVKAGGDK